MSENGKWDFGWPVTIAIGITVLGLLGLAAMNKLPTEMFGIKWASSTTSSPNSSTTESPNSMFNETPESAWKFIGKALTGETIFVGTTSIKKSGLNTMFTYRIGEEVITARADCSRNQWYANGYNKWYSPSSQATQDMLSYICK